MTLQKDFNYISQRVNSLSPSATLAMAQKSAELREEGIDIINMAVGEPDFNTPDFIKQAAKDAVDHNYSHYSPVPGYMSLRKAIAEKLRRENGLHFEPQQIVVGNGAKQELANAILAVINPGEEVIIPTPAWVSYLEMVKLAEGVSVEVKTTLENDFKITPQQLRSVITDRTRLFMLNSPCNPTGSVYSAEELQDLADVLAEFPHVLVLADDIYEHINFNGMRCSIAQCKGLEDRVIVVNGVSKAYAMTGWRIGFLAAPIAIAKAITKLQGQTTSGCSSIAQKAAEAAYTGPQACVEEMRVAFQRRRDLIMKCVKEIPSWRCSEPQGAFYIFPDVSALVGKTDGKRVINSSADYVMYLLEEAHVATVDGASFCSEGHIRLSYALDDDSLLEAMRRIAAATAALTNK